MPSNLYLRLSPKALSGESTGIGADEGGRRRQWPVPGVSEGKFHSPRTGALRPFRSLPVPSQDDQNGSPTGGLPSTASRSGGADSNAANHQGWGRTGCAIYFAAAIRAAR